MANKSIYSRSSLNDMRGDIQGSYYKSNRPDILSTRVADDLNTYKNWPEFDLAFPKVWNLNDKNEIVQNIPQLRGKGKKSLFSNVAGVYGSKDGKDVPLRTALNIPLLDTAEVREDIRKRTDCTIKNLVARSATGKMSRMVYNYSDFMYCKYLGKIPNNYMITLRKFPMPCGDHIGAICDADAEQNNHLPDMGRLVTWLGTPGNDMSNILSYSYSMPWQENTAPFDDEVNTGENGGGKLGQFLSALDGSYGKQLVESRGGVGSNWVAGMLGGGNGEGAINLDLRNNNRIVAERQNVIAKVWVPGGAKGGLEFTHDIKLTFDYELRSYDGINGRSAMLDLLANILMVTYMQGQFFAGSYRSTGMAMSNIYSNLDIFKDSETIKNPANFMSSLFSSMTQIAEGLGFKQGSSPKEALKNIGNNIFTILANGFINKLGRANQVGMTSFISPAATGNWHLTVGNPLNPILSIGNLILKDAQIEHYGPLGLDDFPTGLKVTVTLNHARPRDSVAIEQMYMNGDHRIYTPMGEQISKMYDNAKTIIHTEEDRDSADIESGPAYISKSISKKIVSTQTTDTSKIYKKYFGTDDTRKINITAGEALVGAAKKNDEVKK